MAFSVLIPYQVMEDTSNLRNCLRTLKAQTWPASEILVLDDSLDFEPVKFLCESMGVQYVPFVHTERPQWAKKFNTAVPMLKGDKILLLCANWLLARYALEVMERAIDRRGPGHIVVSDSQRQQMDNADGQPIDWFSYLDMADTYTLPCLNCHVRAYHVNKGVEYAHSLIDTGYLTALHRADWIPWDEEFDQFGSWHAVIEWGYRLLYKHDKELWILRGLIAFHQPTGFTHVPGDWIAQTKASQRLLAQKIPGQAAE